MSLSRRSFFRNAGAAGFGLLSADILAARGSEALAGLAAPPALEGAESKRRAIKINSNENAYGPSPSALDAARSVLGVKAGRYPTNVPALNAAVARHFDIRPENVIVGTGSGELISAAVSAFTSSNRALVQAMPTWEGPGRSAARRGTPIKNIPVDANLRLDLTAMSAAANGAGLVFFCNPNNPTGTVRSKTDVTGFIEELLKQSPETTILLDEAYFDFVVDPAFDTGVPLAMKYPRVLVTRTFSKVHGMAGLRIGYAIGHPDTLKAVAESTTGSMNLLSAAAAAASIQDTVHVAKQRDLNRATLEATRRTFQEAGCQVSDSQGNFIFADVKRPAKEFREACDRMGVVIGRDFPPLTNWARITIGTTEEMQVANEVFRKVLTASPTTSSATA